MRKFPYGNVLGIEYAYWELDAGVPGKDFIICTGEQFPFYTDASCNFVAGWLRMGDRLSYLEEEGQEVQYRAMIANDPFYTIQVTHGRSQLYLGEYESTPFVFDTHGYKYTGEDEMDYVIRRSCIYTPELPGYMLKGSITFVELK